MPPAVGLLSVSNAVGSTFEEIGDPFQEGGSVSLGEGAFGLEAAVLGFFFVVMVVWVWALWDAYRRGLSGWVLAIALFQVLAIAPYLFVRGRTPVQPGHSSVTGPWG